MKRYTDIFQICSAATTLAFALSVPLVSSSYSSTYSDEGEEPCLEILLNEKEYQKYKKPIEDLHAQLERGEYDAIKTMIDYEFIKKKTKEERDLIIKRLTQWKFEGPAVYLLLKAHHKEILNTSKFGTANELIEMLSRCCSYLLLANIRAKVDSHLIHQHEKIKKYLQRKHKESAALVDQGATNQFEGIAKEFQTFSESLKNLDAAERINTMRQITVAKEAGFIGDIYTHLSSKTHFDEEAILEIFHKSFEIVITEFKKEEFFKVVFLPFWITTASTNVLGSTYFNTKSNIVQTNIAQSLEHLISRETMTSLMLETLEEAQNKLSLEYSPLPCSLLPETFFKNSAKLTYKQKTELQKSIKQNKMLYQIK